jgi:hypothetical protein
MPNTVAQPSEPLWPPLVRSSREASSSHLRELFFRGALSPGSPALRCGWPLASAILAWPHHDTAAVVAASFVIGLVNAYLFERTRSIWVPITVHDQQQPALLFTWSGVQKLLALT